MRKRINKDRNYVLSLDPATTTGYAILSFFNKNKINLQDYGHFRCQLKKNEKGGLFFILFEEFLDKFYSQYDNENLFVVFEYSQFRQSSIAAYHRHGALINKIMEYFHRKDIPYDSMGFSEIKKYAIGKPKMLSICPSCGYDYKKDDENKCKNCNVTRVKDKINKEYVRREIEKRFNINVDKDDESDAIACGVAYINKNW